MSHASDNDHPREDSSREELNDGLDAEAEDPPARRPVGEVIALLARDGEPLPYNDLRALSDCDDETTRQLLQLWPSVGPERRREILAAAQRLCEDEATLDFDRVYISALHDPDPATRILAIRGLWEHEREELAPVLTHLLRNDAEATVRVEAAAALGRFVVSVEFDMLSEEVAEQVFDALRDAITEDTEEDEVRATALEAIGASSDESVGELIAEHYELGSTRLRLAAVRAMGRNAADGWLPVLLQTFQDEDEDVRAAAATSTGQLLLEEAVDPLVLLIEEDEEDVQVAAIGALGEISGETAEQVLTALLDRPEPHIVDAARIALAESRLMSVDMLEADLNAEE